MHYNASRLNFTDTVRANFRRVWSLIARGKVRESSWDFRESSWSCTQVNNRSGFPTERERNYPPRLKYRVPRKFPPRLKFRVPRIVPPRLKFRVPRKNPVDLCENSESQLKFPIPNSARLCSAPPLLRAPRSTSFRSSCGRSAALLCSAPLRRRCAAALCATRSEVRGPRSEVRARTIPRKGGTST